MKYEPLKEVNERQSTKRKNELTQASVQLRLTLYRFYAQIGFSLIVVGLSVWQLASKDNFEAAERAIYWSSLSGTVANWLPSPLEKVDSGRRRSDEEEEEEDS